MQNTIENITALNGLLEGEEKLALEVRDGDIVAASAYIDDYKRTPGDFSRGNYYRWLYTNGSFCI